MSYDFAWEPLSLLLDDGLAEIVARHWQEVGVHQAKMPLAVDWERYHALEAQGVLKVMAARAEAALVGYASFLVLPHLHYATTLHAMNDAIYVEPARRGLGIRLIRAAEQALAVLVAPKPIRIIYHAKLHVEEERGTLARVFERLGYRAVETTHDKVVGAP